MLKLHSLRDGGSSPNFFFQALEKVVSLIELDSMPDLFTVFGSETRKSMVHI